jgi:hypothetical protein
MLKRVLIVVLVLVVAAFGWAFWLLPMGQGEYRDSPDGLWRAHVSANSRGTLLLSRQRYVELRIERLADGSTTWRQEMPHTDADSVPDYGDRSARFVWWSPDSAQFTVLITNNATVTIPLTVLPAAQLTGPAKGSKPTRPETNAILPSAGSSR